MQAQGLKLFFSYARADSEFVLRLAEDMRSAGVDLWISGAERSLPLLHLVEMLYQLRP